MNTPMEKLNRAMEIAKKWEDPSVGATTEELKELKQLNIELVDEAIKIIANQESDKDV